MNPTERGLLKRAKTAEMRLTFYKGNLRALELELQRDIQGSSAPRTRYFRKYMHERLKSCLDMLEAEMEQLSYIEVE